MRILLPLASCFLPYVLSAQPGSLDPSFSGDGLLTMNISDEDVAYSIVAQPDGKILACGEVHDNLGSRMALARYMPDGSLDLTFDGDGVFVTDPAVQFGSGSALVVQPDGKIVVCGTGGTSSDRHFAVARFEMNGSLDPGFGMAGIVITDIAGGHDQASSIALQPDGMIVVAGTGNAVADRFAVVRYDTYGVLDPTFGSGGKVITAIGLTELASAVLLQPDGKILVAGVVEFLSGADMAIIRLDSDGGFNGSFGTNGVVTTDINSSTDVCFAAALQPDGRIIVAGWSSVTGGYPDFAAVRYDSDGALDDQFGSGGFVIIDIGLSNDQCRTLVIQPDGKIILAGSSNSGSGNEFMLARFGPDGAADLNFGNNGLVTTSIGVGDDDAYGMAMQADGKVLLVGAAEAGTGSDWALARYHTGLNVGVGGYAEEDGDTSTQPNPFIDQVVLNFEMQYAGEVSCRVFDAQGRVVRLLIPEDFRTPGVHQEVFDLSELTAGPYSLVMRTNSISTSRRIVKQ